MNPFGINMNHFMALADTASTNNPISFDYTLIVELVSFLILVWILKRFAWKPLLAMMEKRRQMIADNISHAEQERKEAERIRAEYQQEMQTARQEAQLIIERATKSSELRAQEILDAARKESENFKASAMSQIEQERDKAIADVKSQVAELSIAVAEKLLQHQLDHASQSKLIDQFIQEVGTRS